MNKKLTLKLDDDVIEKAKGYARKRHKSLSQLVENYFRMITREGEKEEELTPIVKSLSGIIKLQEDENVKEEYTRYLIEKYR